MNRILFFMSILLLFFSTSLFSDKFHDYSEQKIYLFSIGSENSMFKINRYPNPDESFGPSTFSFDEYGNCYIVDTWNSQIKKYNYKFELIDQINLSNNFFIDSSREIIIRNDIIYTFSDLYKSFCSILQNDKVKSLIIFENSEIEKELDFNNYLHLGRYFFHYLDNGGVTCIFEPEIDTYNDNKNMNKILMNEEVHAMLQPDSGYDIGSLTIDEKNRLFFEGELLTKDYDTYFEYWQDKHGDNPAPSNAMVLDGVNQARLQSTYFIGKDKNKNVYWRHGRGGVLVFNPTGWLIDAIDYNDDKSRTLPSIHPSGDIYLLDYDSKEVTLYRVKNVWDPEGRAQWYKTHDDISPITEQFGTLNDSRVRFRDEPNLQGVHLGYLDKNERVEILDQSQNKMQIGEMNDYWYQIKRENGQTGWAYGYFIDLED